MKFTDGNWMMREGVKAAYAADVYEVEMTERELTIVAPCASIHHRGQTLNGPIFTIRASSPMADVIRITAAHYTGGGARGPEFETSVDLDAEPSTEWRDGQAVLTSGRLSARFAQKSRWGLDFIAGERIVTSMNRLGVMSVDGGGAHLAAQLSLGVGESVYGFGERFTAFVKNGQVVETWNKDGGTGSEQAYKSVPFYLTDRGYGVFVADPGAVSFEVASEKVSQVQFSVPGETLDVFVIYGPTPKEILTKYTALTGRPALPPAWSFGLWLTTSFTTSYDEATISKFIDGMAQREIPLHVFHFDCFWMREYRWCDFEWDRRVFSDPPAMLRRLKERGLKVCVWINPYIAQLSPLFAEGAAAGYLLKRADGGVWQSDQWQPGMGIVDFTNPDARAWYSGKLAALLDMGVDCFKTDFGERIPTDVAYFDGSDPQKMHNYYALLYNQTVFDLLEKRRGTGDAVVFARSATAGGQKFPVHWGGDCNSTFESMAESLRGGLSLGLSGFGYWSHDIGGFEGTPPADIYKRWVAFGLLSSHSRLHGSSSYRVPWVYDDEAVDVLRHFTKLKCRLMPYLYGAALEAHLKGIPMMRAMMLEFPADPACASLDRQYMLGDSLLVAPVFSSDGAAEYYLPEGIWTDLATGERIAGGRWQRRAFDYFSIPLLARPDSIIAAGKCDTRPDYDYADGVMFVLSGLSDGCNLYTTVPDSSGGRAGSVHVTRAGNQVRVQVFDLPGAWRVRLAGVPSVASVSDGILAGAPQGVVVDMPAGASCVEITLKASAPAPETAKVALYGNS